MSLEARRKAIVESGYQGEKVVVLDSTDYSFLSSGARISADLMTRLGMNVDVQSMDFGTLLQRRNNMEPVEKGGWSMFCTGADVLSLANPGLNYYVRGWVGGYKNETINGLLDQWLGANDPKQLQQLFEQIQNVSFDDVPMIPLGQFKLRHAYRKDLQGILRSSSATFWNVKRESSDRVRTMNAMIVRDNVIHGTVSPGFESVRGAFAANFRNVPATMPNLALRLRLREWQASRRSLGRLR